MLGSNSNGRKLIVPYAPLDVQRTDDDPVFASLSVRKKKRLKYVNGEVNKTTVKGRFTTNVYHGSRLVFG